MLSIAKPVAPLPPIPSVLKAAPLLSLTLERIARTQLARLAIGMRVPLRCDEFVVYPWQRWDGWLVQASHRPDYDRVNLAEFDISHWPQRLTDRNLRPIGNGLWLDTVLAGLNVGDPLPIANRTIDQREDSAGLQVNFVA